MRKKLSAKSRKFIKELKKNPGAPIVEIARKIGCSPDVYYRLLQKDDWAQRLPEIMDELLSAQLIPVLQSCVARALAGSGKHIEILFKCAGLLEADGSKLVQIFGKEVQEGSPFLTTRQIDELLGVARRRNEPKLLVGRKEESAEPDPDQQPEIFEEP